MTLGEFLNNDNLLNLELEAIRNRDKFKTLMKEAEICLFGKTLDPIIYTNECDFTKTNDISDPELNKKGLYLFRYFFSRYTSLLNLKKSIFNVFEEGVFTIKLNDHFNDLFFNDVNNVDKNNKLLDKKDESYQLNDYLLAVIGKKYDTKNTFIENYNITQDDEYFEYYYQESFYPNFKWWWFPYKVNLRNSNLEVIQIEELENYYGWLLEQSVKNSNDKKNNFKIKKEKLNMKIDNISNEKNSLTLLNQQFLYGFRRPVYNTRRICISGKIFEPDPFKLF